MQEAEAGECDVEVDADLVDVEFVGTWLLLQSILTWFHRQRHGKII